MKFTHLSLSLLFFVILFSGCSKDEPVVKEAETITTPNPDPKEEEEEEEEEENSTYFTLKIANDYYLEILQKAYIVIHDADGNLLDYKEYKNGDTLTFDAEPEQTISDKITITKFLYNRFSNNGDYYNIHTYPLIDKGSEWSFNSIAGNYFPTGEFDITVNNIPNWNFYTLSNIHGFGTSGSRYYKYFNNPEEAEPNFSIDGTNLFAENDFILSVIDGDKNLKYTEILNVQADDAIILDNEDLIDFDSYLIVTLPDYDEFYFGVSAYESEQDFSSEGITLNKTREYSFSETVTEIELGFLDNYTKYRTSILVDKDDYTYQLKNYGAKPNSVTIPENGNLTISDGSLENFEFQADFNYIRSTTHWSTRRDFLDPEFSSVTWVLVAPNTDEFTIYELPEEITSKYSNLDIDQLIHKKTELFTQSDSYENALKRSRNEAKIEGNYIEESMLFGEYN